jgi:hypothetical protein
MYRSRLCHLASVLVALASAACGSGAGKPPVERAAIVERLPGDGAHFTLEVVAVPDGNAADLGGDDGRRLFVPLAGRTNILLGEGDFLVLDANGTDGSAYFQLPNADPARSRATAYSVWARAVGAPDITMRATRCARDDATGELFCRVAERVLVRSAGGSTDVSKALLYVDPGAAGAGADRYPLFDSVVGDLFWRSDGRGQRLAQLRFYEVAGRAP